MTQPHTPYQWHGEPVQVVFGSCLVTINTEKPLWWYNYECNKDEGSACTNAIQVTYGNQQFLIANHFGIGVHKLLNGGWPNYQHFGIDGKFIPETSFEPWQRAFDLEGFEQYEAARCQWQKENYPEEFEKMERLRKAVQKLYKSIN